MQRRFDLFMCAPDGSQLTRLTRTPDDDEDFPAWSPDGTRVAFTRYVGGFEQHPGELWVMNAGGGLEKRLFGGAHDHSFPDWSPDGRSIALAHDSRVAVARADGSTLRLLTPRGGDYKEMRPDWSADGRRILFSRDPGEVMVMDADGSHAAGAYVAARRVAGEDESAARSAGAKAADRGLFALDPRSTNLTTFLLASHPRPLRDAIDRHRRGLDADSARYLRDNESRLEDEARAAAARYLGAASDEVALTDSTTMGLGLVYARLRLRPGDEVVTSVHDFYATHEALRLRRQLDGVKVRRVRLYDEPRSAAARPMSDAVSRALGPRTRAVALTWVHSSTGVKLPLHDIAGVIARANRGRRARERILLVVDGVHGFGVEDASPAALGVDVFVSGCHKWLFGPRGTGLVWATAEAWERLAPTIPTFDPTAYIAWLEGRPPVDTPPGRLNTPGGFHAFEHRWALPEAFAVHDDLGGRAEVARATHALAARLKARLAAIDGVEVKTPASEALSSGLVCAEIAGTPPEEIVDRLRDEHRVIASVTPYTTRYLRFGPSVANSEEDVDRALAAVAAIVLR